MSLTIGNVQKFASLAIKHYWCHGLIVATPDSAPIDRYVIEAATDQLRLAGVTAPRPVGPWSSYDLTQYRVAYELVSRAAGVCGLTAAEWELYVFQPGNGANALIPGAPLVPLDQAKNQFLIVNNRAAKPGDSRQLIDAHAKTDARSAAFLMGARPYDMPKSQIDRLYPRQFDAFKVACEQESLRIANQVSINPARNRSWYEREFISFLQATRTAFLFV